MAAEQEFLHAEHCTFKPALAPRPKYLKSDLEEAKLPVTDRLYQDAKNSLQRRKDQIAAADEERRRVLQGEGWISDVTLAGTLHGGQYGESGTFSPASERIFSYQDNR